MTRLHDLFSQQGQSPWLDNLRRGWITSGELARWVDDGVRGLTSNPSIFEYQSALRCRSLTERARVIVLLRFAAGIGFHPSKNYSNYNKWTFCRLSS